MRHGCIPRWFLITALCLGLTACAPVRVLNGLVDTSEITSVRDVPYGPGPRQALDIYRPKSTAKNLPVIVFFYGGSWQSGERRNYLFVAQTLAEHGFLVIIPDYRLYPQAAYPAFLEDCARAVVWAHRHAGEYGGDPSRLTLMGHSAGAYNAAMLALNARYITEAGGDPAWIGGMIGLAGPYDFLPLTDPKLVSLFGGNNRIQTQPITYVGRNRPPMLLLTGLADEEVRPHNSIALAARMKDAGNDVELVTYPKLGHIGIVLELASPLHAKTDLVARVVRFASASHRH